MKNLPLFRSVKGLPLAAALLAAGCAPAIVSSARKGDLPAVQRLIAKGADVNAKDGGHMGESPLHVAARYKHPEIVHLLLQKGADPNQVNGIFRNFNETPLHWVLAWNCDETTKRIVKLLIEAGANTQIRDGDGQTPLDHWSDKAEPCQREIAAMLREAPKTQAEAKERKAKEAADEAKSAELQSALAAVLPRLEAAEREGDAALQASQKEKALERYCAALRESPPGAAPEQGLREKIVRTALSMTPAPPVPEEAQHMSRRAKSFLKYAEDSAGYSKAAEELEGALRLAPWWAEAYFNLGLVREKLGAPADAIRALKLYLLAAPGALDAETVRSKLVDLEVRQELPSLRAPQR